jgi:hypothetical protein
MDNDFGGASSATMVKTGVDLCIGVLNEVVQATSKPVITENDMREVVLGMQAISQALPRVLAFAAEAAGPMGEMIILDMVAEHNG